MNLDGFGAIGFYNLAFLSLSCALGSFYSTYVMNKIGIKLCLSISALANSIWIFSTIFAAEKQENPNSNSIIQSKTFVCSIGLILSCLNGACFSIFWVSNGTYLSSCANALNKGVYFGIAYSFYNSS
jgi:hypothetical protein